MRRWLCARPRRGWLALLLLSVASLGAAGASLEAAQLAAVGQGAQAERPALVLSSGSIARDQLVALGRDLVVDGEARGDAAALKGSIRVSGLVDGDVIALGGDVELASTARVEGGVFVLGGSIHAQPGAEIRGSSVSYPSASSAWLTLLEGPSLGLSSFSPVVLGAKLGLLAAWLVLVLLIFALAGREALSTSVSVQGDPFRGFFVGLTGVVTLLLTCLFLTSFSPTLVGVPLLFVVVLAAIGLKLWGMVAVFHALGAWIAQHLLRRRLTPLHAATLGLFVLGIIKLIPYAGVLAWTAATFIGVGASLLTKLGRREPWFAVVPSVG